MKEDITAYILTRLAREASEDDLIYSVCEKTGWSWGDAQTLVEQIKQEHLTDIEVREAPLKSLLSFVFYLVGIILIIGPIVYLWVMLDVTSTFLAFISSGFSTDTETAFKLLGSRCVLLGWFELPSIFFPMLLGFGIIRANLRSMSKVWEALFRKWKVLE